MASVTLSIENNAKEGMKRFPEVNWSGFIRKKLEEKMRELEWREEMLERLNSEKAETGWEIQKGREVNAAMARRLKKEGLL